jgi:hypothetical protein
MEQATTVIPPTRLELAFKHWWLHLALGATGSGVLLATVEIWSRTSQGGPSHWQDMVFSELLMVLLSCAGAALVGMLRLPVMEWMMGRAQQRQWSLKKLLLASAALFLTPILPIFLLGKTWHLIGWVSLALSFPFFVAYVAASYQLRERIYALPGVDL